ADEPCAGVPPLDGEPFTFAVPRNEDLEFFGDRERAALFDEAAVKLQKLGGRPHAIDLSPFHEVAALLYEGPWLAERLAGLEDFLKNHEADVYPVTREILLRGVRFSGADVFRAQARLAVLREQCSQVFAAAEMLVVPTMPALPTLAQVQADSL